MRLCEDWSPPFIRSPPINPSIKGNGKEGKNREKNQPKVKKQKSKTRTKHNRKEYILRKPTDGAALILM